MQATSCKGLQLMLVACVIIIGSVLLLGAGFTISIPLRPSRITRLFDGVLTPRAANGCRDVYLDLGTNTGVQFHKLYNPDAFPDSIVAPYFDAYYGDRTKRLAICSFGWEPNPAHASILKHLVTHYTAKGARVQVTYAAAGRFDGTGIFISDGDLANREWASRVEPLPPGYDGPRPSEAVDVVDAASWILHHVVGRSGGEGGKVVMKLDIEGADEGLLGGLVRNGGLCSIDLVYTEAHVRHNVSNAYQQAMVAAGCPTRIIYLDDEWHREYVLPDYKEEPVI
jgi:hypothetical protein